MNSAFLSSGISGICQYFHLVFIILLRNTSNSPGGFLLFHGFGTGFSELVVITRGLRQRWGEGGCVWSSEPLVGALVGLLSLGVSCLPQLWRDRGEEKQGYEVEGVERGQR